MPQPDSLAWLSDLWNAIKQGDHSGWRPDDYDEPQSSKPLTARDARGILELEQDPTFYPQGGAAPASKLSAQDQAAMAAMMGDPNLGKMAPTGTTPISQADQSHMDAYLKQLQGPAQQFNYNDPTVLALLAQR